MFLQAVQDTPLHLCHLYTPCNHHNAMKMEYTVAFAYKWNDLVRKWMVHLPQNKANLKSYQINYFISMFDKFIFLLRKNNGGVTF